MNNKLKSIQNDVKKQKKHTKSPNAKPGGQPGGQSKGQGEIMLKMAFSYSIFLLIILILFFYLYVSASKNAHSQYQWQIKSTLMSNVELFEKDLNIMDVYCRQLLQDTSFRKLLRTDASNPGFQTLGGSVATNMSTDVYPEALLPVSEVFCYLPESGYLIAPSYFSTQERYYHWMKRYDDSAYDAWLETLTSPDGYYHFLPMDAFIPDSNNIRYYMCIINIDDLYYMDADAVVCFVMEESRLSSLFDCMDADFDYRYLSVRTNDNNCILSLATDQSENFDHLIADGTITDADGFLESNGISIGFYESSDSGYCYYFSYPSYETVTNYTRPLILYLTLAAALIAGIALVLLLAKRSMRPIIALDQQLQAAKQEKDDLIEEKSHLQEVMDNQRPILRSSYVRQLLKGTIVSEEEASYAKDFLGLNGDGLVFNCLYVVAYNNISVEQSSTSGFSASRDCNEIVTERLQRRMGDQFYCFSPSDRTYGLILAGNDKDERDLIIKANEIIVQLHDELLDAYGIWLFAGIGKNTNDIVNVWESYQQAVEAVNYTGRNHIFLPYEFIKKDSRAFYYPPELSTKLIHFITTGNTSQVYELFNLLHQENIEERSLPINMLQFLLSDIRNTLLKARFALPPNTPEDAVRALDESFNQHVSFKLCEDIALRLCKLFTSESDDADLVSAIEKYIRENYADPSMGLNKISDEFQISESYFSHMFKEKTGVNFSTYLENIRLGEAARLIRETDVSLSDLYISVGYNNANTFRRAFKKVYGVTPSAMRDAK